VFAAQEAAYRDSVLPPGTRRVSIEAGATGLWYRWIGADGLAIGIDHYGASAPYQRIADEFGFTPAKVAAKIKSWLG